MKAFVAVTDPDWFHHLRSRNELEEANFWQPGGGRRFRALRPGEPFLFKLRSPQDFIVGGGFFAHSCLLPASLAWEAFETRNGALSYEEMRLRIERHRHLAANPHADYGIGCILLQTLFVFDRLDWIPVPDDFHRNVGQGKLYDLEESSGRRLWESVRQRLRASSPLEVAVSQTSLFSEPLLLHRRLGPGGFRLLLTDIYRRRCAMTGESALPALEAAHIRPPSAGGLNRIDNGLLIRADLHRLYRQGYLTVLPDYRIRVSSKLSEEFPGTDSYAELEERKITVPRRLENRPRSGFLEWHADVVFRG